MGSIPSCIAPPGLDILPRVAVADGVRVRIVRDLKRNSYNSKSFNLREKNKYTIEKRKKTDLK